MKINFFNRYYYPNQISIEKLFSILKDEMERKGFIIQQYSNPYKLTPFGIIKALFYFQARQSQINHITGDISWCSLLLNKKNTIITIHDLGGMDSLSGIKRKIFFLLWIYLPVTKAKYVTVISHKTKKELVRLMPSAEGKIRVIHNCYTLPIVKKEKRSWNRLTKILIVGTRENKNIENIILALQGLSCHLSIVGVLNNKQKEILDNCNITYINYEFLSDESLISLYQESDILAFISKYEGFGLPILEAHALDCAVITSNIEPMMEVAGNAAYFVNPFDIQDIRAGIVELLNNVNLRERLIVNGAVNLKRFEVEKIAQEYINLYNEITYNLKK